MQFARHVSATVEENSGCGLNSATLMHPHCGQMPVTQYEVLSECDPDTSGCGLAHRDHSVGKNKNQVCSDWTVDVCRQPRVNQKVLLKQVQ